MVIQVSDQKQEASNLKIAYLFTTFPVLTETTFQREIRILKTKNIELLIYSLWGGEKEFENLPIIRFRKFKLIFLFWWFPYWMAKKPGVFRKLWGEVCRIPFHSWGSLCETFIGFSFSLIYANELKNRAPGLIHAAWATMPASAGLLVKNLTGIPYSMEGHAYDVFQNGGAWLLRRKIKEAEFVRTSSESTRSRLLEFADEREKLILVRRGLDKKPPMSEIRNSRIPLRILSVGRLIEKMGYFDQIRVYSEILADGIDFNVRIIGGGPLLRSLERLIQKFGLEGKVTLLGSQPFDSVIEQLIWADLFVYTGLISKDGDRAGFPNAVGEAMAAGVPVLSTAVAGIPEAIEHGRSGVVCDINEPLSWVDPMRRLQRDDGFYSELRKGARNWIDSNFDGWRNVDGLYQVFRKHCN